MSKVTQTLQEGGAQLQTSTLKGLFDHIYASDKNSPLKPSFWTAEQWEKGIEGLPTSVTVGKTEHWFQVDIFNSVINVIDNKYKSLSEKVSAFIDHVKTVDSTFVTESDQLDDDTVLKRGYETLFAHALRTDLINISNTKPHNVIKLINKLGIKSKFSTKIQNTITRLSRPSPIPDTFAASFIINKGDEEVKKGDFKNITKRVIEVAKNLYEYEIYLEKSIIELNSGEEEKMLELTLKLSNVSTRQILSFSGKVSFLQSPLITENFLDTYIYCKQLKAPEDVIEIKVPIYMVRTTKHMHYMSAERSENAGTLNNGVDGVRINKPFPSGNMPDDYKYYSYYEHVMWNGTLLEAFNVNKDHGTEHRMEDVKITSFTGYTPQNDLSNHIKLQNFFLRGTLCLS